MENKKMIINIGRQIGSGGRIIAKQLAKDLNCTFYDRELLNLAAKESGFSEKFFEQNDERKGFLHSLLHVNVPLMGENTGESACGAAGGVLLAAGSRCLAISHRPSALSVAA